MTDKPKRKYTKRVTLTEPIMIPEGAVVTGATPAVMGADIHYEVPEATRRRSAKPVEPKPEIEPVAAPKLAALAPYEVHGLVEEAIYAHDMQDVIVRYDTMGRKWTFRPDQDKGHAVFFIECSIPAVTENLTISNSRFGLDKSRDEVQSAIEQLDEVVR